MLASCWFGLGGKFQKCEREKEALRSHRQENPLLFVLKPPVGVGGGGGGGSVLLLGSGGLGIGPENSPWGG